MEVLVAMEVKVVMEETEPEVLVEVAVVMELMEEMLVLVDLGDWEDFAEAVEVDGDVMVKMVEIVVYLVAVVVAVIKVELHVVVMEVLM